MNNGNDKYVEDPRYIPAILRTETLRNDVAG